MFISLDIDYAQDVTPTYPIVYLYIYIYIIYNIYNYYIIIYTGNLLRNVKLYVVVRN